MSRVGRGGVPSRWIMRLMSRITSASMRRREHPLPIPIRIPWVVQLNLHQLIHPAANQHIPIKQDNPLKLSQRKHAQLRPRLSKPRILIIPSCAGARGQTGDLAGWDAAGGENGKGGGREGGCVECDEGVCCSGFEEGMVQG